MKDSYYRTPRTLNECQFSYGSTTLPVHETRAERVAGICAAVLIGVGLAAALVSWWSS